MDEFEKLLYQGSAQLPPELPGQEPPRPWKRPMKRICWGIALINVTLNFLGLDVILPLAGVILLWLGLRSLRRENGGFRFAYGCATVYAVLRFAAVVLQATPLDVWLTELPGEWGTAQGPVPLYYVLRVIVFQSILTLAAGGLWRGLKAVFESAGQKPRTAAVGGLVILEALLIPLALIGVEGWLLVGPVLLLWALLVRNLWKLSRSLDEVGYALKPAPVRLPGIAAVGLWVGIPALMLAVLPLGFNRLPVSDSTPVYSPSVRDEELYKNLLNLGFPEDMLSSAELELGSDTLSYLFRDAYGLTVNGWPISTGPYPDNIPYTVMFEVPVRDEKYGFRTVYLAYLRWDAEETADGGYMEGIKIVPDWHGVAVHASVPQGRLVWYDDGDVYHEAPLAFQFHTVNSSTPAYFADFSLPKEADGPVEGWVYWDLAPTFPEKPMFYNYGLSVAHRLTSWQYPYRLPSDVLQSGNGGTWWRTMERPYLGHMAPEGTYTSDTFS